MDSAVLEQESNCYIAPSCVILYFEKRVADTEHLETITIFSKLFSELVRR